MPAAYEIPSRVKSTMRQSQPTGLEPAKIIIIMETEVLVVIDYMQNLTSFDSQSIFTAYTSSFSFFLFADSKKGAQCIQHFENKSDT
jgi:hypothetical protein